MNKQQLASKIWESANQMRSKIEANEYKDYILGFIFYKFLSDKLEQFAKSQGFADEDIAVLSEDDPETVEFLQQNLGYFIAFDNLFSTWLDKGSDFTVANVRDALSAFSRLIHKNHKQLFDGIFNTLQTGLSKLGTTAGEQSKAISSLIHLIKDIPTDERQGYDVLGFIYEYLIGMFAANAGKKAGEFYTPHEVSLLMSEIVAEHLKDRKQIDIYDPTSGSGSLLLNIGAAIAKHMTQTHNIKYYAQELKENTYNLTRMNLVMRGIKPDNIETRNADTLEADWPWFDDNDPVNTYSPLYLDAVVSNPPYSQKWDPTDKENDPRYARFGLAPKSKADYAFLLHDLYHLKPDGIMAIVLPHGVLFRGGEEGQIRKNLIEASHIDTIIGLPSNIFFGTGIPTIIMVLKQKRNNSDVLIVDASKGFAKEGKNNKLRARDIRKIVDVVTTRTDLPQFSRLVSKEELRDNNYNLNIPRYVDSAEPAESWDLYASMFGGIPNCELDALADYWNAFPQLRDSLFSDGNTPYSTPVVDDFAAAIEQHPSVQAYRSNFKKHFDTLPDFLSNKLIGKDGTGDTLSTLNVHQQLEHLTRDLFKRAGTVSLLDQYAAYQLLSDQWEIIAADLEILQSEGMEATTVVEPNMVSKKVKGIDTEVQEGWRGRVLPFELVQTHYLQAELGQLAAQQNRLAEIQSSCGEMLENLDEEEKDSLISSEILSENGDAWRNAAVAKEAKTLRDDAKAGGALDEESLDAKIIQLADWLDEEKKLKKAVQESEAALHLLTKKTLENLNAEQTRALLEAKWIAPLIEQLEQLAAQPVTTLAGKLQALAEKYRITFADNAHAIAATGHELAEMMSELTGSEFDLKGIVELQNILQGGGQP